VGLRQLAALGTVALLVATAVAGPAGPAAAHPDRPSEQSRQSARLPERQQNVELVGRAQVLNPAAMAVGDVTVHGNYAYLAGFVGSKCTGGGVHVFDIQDLRRPRAVGFVPTGKHSFVGEGMQVVSLQTASFAGAVLLFQNEVCERPDSTTVGGATLVDVTDPAAPKVLAAGFGDRQPRSLVRAGMAHMVHSAFAWTTGDRAYAVLVDDEEEAAVDIFEITDPREPVQIAEYDVPARFPQVLQRGKGLDEVLFHDAVVKETDGRQVMLLSYWDAGYVKLDVTDPHNPIYLADSDFAAVDPQMREQTGATVRPEGNAHEAEFTKDNRFIVAADEDFSTRQLTARTDDGDTLIAADGGVRERALGIGRRVSAKVVYVVRACTRDPTLIPAPLAGGPYFAVAELGNCEPAEQVRNVELAGYAGTVLFGREGRFGCGLPRVRVGAFGAKPVLSMDRRSAHALFDKQRSYSEDRCRAGNGSRRAAIARGARGDVVRFQSVFDGWGYMRLFRNADGKLTELDTYAIPEAMNVRYVGDFGILSVHEAATSHQRADLVYSSYYSGGLRVLKIADDRLHEVGAFIDRGGNTFWGVEVFERDGQEFVAASDMDHGLYLFRYTGAG
jgi:hypothetical protein